MFKSKLFLIIIISFCFLIYACSSDSGGTATVSINTGLGMEKAATKAPAPSTLTSITVTVTGPAMESISKIFNLSDSSSSSILPVGGEDITFGAGKAVEDSSYVPSTGILTIEVPAGTARVFTLKADVNPADPGVVLEWTGSETQNIVEGENAVAVAMAITKTKILVPDFRNSQIVMINDPSASTAAARGWIARNGTDIGYLPTKGNAFYPHDIDFDASGRIYIANYGDPIQMISANNDVIRINDMNDTAAEEVVASAPGRIYALSIDRVNNLLYFSTGMSVFVKDLGSSVVPQNLGLTMTETISSTPTIVGMEADGLGNLYIVDSMGNSVIKLKLDNDVGSRNVGQYNPSAYPATLMDVTIRSGNVYVTGYNGDPLSAIQQLDTNLALVDNNGTIAYPPSKIMDFYGPHRFAALLNRKIYVTDDAGSTTAAARLVGFDNLDGIGWETYGQIGSANTEGSFRFWCTC